VITECVLFQKLTDLDQARSCQTRSIQSDEKEHADLSGRSGHGHLVLVYAEHRRLWHPAAQMGVAKSDLFRCVRADQIWLRTRSVSLRSI